MVVDQLQTNGRSVVGLPTMAASCFSNSPIEIFGRFMVLDAVFPSAVTTRNLSWATGQAFPRVGRDSCFFRQS